MSKNDLMNSHFALHSYTTFDDSSALKQKALMEKAGDLIVPDDELQVVGTETTIEMNFAIFKIKKTVKKAK